MKIIEISKEDFKNLNIIFDNICKKPNEFSLGVIPNKELILCDKQNMLGNKIKFVINENN